MFKKLKLSFTIIILSFILISCNSNFVQTIKVPFKTSKPSINYYTNNLLTALKNSKNTHISILYTKTGKNKVIPPEQMDNFYLFMNSIKTDFFINPTTSNNEDFKNIEYKLTISINDKNSFVINIFNEDFISIHPWDGTYEADLLCISELNTRINLYNIINYIIKSNV